MFARRLIGFLDSDWLDDWLSVSDWSDSSPLSVDFRRDFFPLLFFVFFISDSEKYFQNEKKRVKINETERSEDNVHETNRSLDRHIIEQTDLKTTFMRQTDHRSENIIEQTDLKT